MHGGGLWRKEELDIQICFIFFFRQGKHNIVVTLQVSNFSVNCDMNGTKPRHKIFSTGKLLFLNVINEINNRILVGGIYFIPASQ